MNRYFTDSYGNLNTHKYVVVREKVYDKVSGKAPYNAYTYDCDKNSVAYHDVQIDPRFINYKIGKALLRLYLSNIKPGVTFKMHINTRYIDKLDFFEYDGGDQSPVVAVVKSDTAQAILNSSVSFIEFEITEHITKMLKSSLYTNYIISNDSKEKFTLLGMATCLSNNLDRCFILATDESGLDNRFEYQQQSAEFAGTGLVNLSSGKLLFSFQGPSTEATDTPFTFGAAYNKKNANIGLLGKYWRSNLEFNFTDEDDSLLSFDKCGALLTDYTGKDSYYQKIVRKEAKKSFNIDPGNESGDLSVCPFDGTYMLSNKDTKKVFDKQGNSITFSVDKKVIYLNEIKTSDGKSLYFPTITSSFSGNAEIRSGDNRLINVTVSKGMITCVDYPYERKLLRFTYLEQVLKTVNLYSKTDAGEELLFKSCQYNYEDGNLVRAYDLMTKRGVKYTYNADKIEKIEQVLLNSSESGPFMTIKYNDNWTKTTSFIGEEANYYFNNFGICTLVTNSENKAVSRNCRLISPEKGVELTSQSPLMMMDSVNLLDNGDFEKDIAITSAESPWKITANDHSKVNVVTNTLDGGKCLAVDKENREVITIYQQLTLKGPAVLTGRLRYRSKDGSKMSKGNVTIEIKDMGLKPALNWDFYIEPVNHHDGWTEFAIPNMDIIFPTLCQIRLTMRGKAAHIEFDDLCLSNGDKPVRNNLIKNGSLTLSNGIIPTNWIFSNMNDREDFLSTFPDASWPKNLYGTSMHFSGDPTKTKSMETTVSAAGEGGEKFSFSFFARGFSHEHDVAQGFIKIGDNRYEFPLEKSNPNWQMVSGIVTTECGFSSIVAGFEYSSSGQVKVGGFYLHRIAEASSYNYSNDTMLSRYNEKDKALTLTDRFGARTYVQYDKDLLPVSIIDSFNNKTISGYNRFGQCIEQTTATFNGLRMGMNAEYDNEARIKKTTDNDGKVTNIDYSKDGVYEVIQQNGPNNLISSLKLDIHGRPYILTSNGIHCDYEYGTDGSLNSINTPINGKYETILDAWGRIEKVVIDDNTYFTNKYELLKNGINTGLLTRRLHSNVSKSLEISYVYDEKYRLKTIKFNNVEKTEFVYDQLNQLIQVIDKTNNKKMNLVYDESGNLIRQFDSDSISSEYTFDDTGAIQRTTHAFDNQECQVDYDYPHELASASHTSYFQRVSEYLGHDVIRDDPKGHGMYGATPLINTVSSGFEANKVIHSMIFDKDTSNILYNLDTINCERKRHRGKDFDLTKWKGDFRKDKVAYAWIKPTGAYADQLLLAFGSTTACYYSVSATSSGRLVLQPAYSASVETTTALVLDKWNLIALQLDGTNGVARAYLNEEVIECHEQLVSPIRLLVGNFFGINEIANSNALEPRDGNDMKLQFRMAFLGIGNGQNFASSHKAITRLGTRMIKEKLTSPFAGVSYGKEDIGNFDIIYLNGNLVSRNGVIPNKNERKVLMNGDYKFSMFEYDEELLRLVYTDYPSGYYLKNTSPLIYNLGLGTEGTISLRIKLEDVQTPYKRNILTCVKDGKKYFQLLVDSKTIKITTNNVTNLSTARTLSFDKWHTITCSWNSLGLRLWLDSGTPFVSNTIIDLSNTQTYIGRDYIQDAPSGKININNLYGKIERLIFGHSMIDDNDLARLLKSSRITTRTTYDQVGRATVKEIGGVTKLSKLYNYKTHGDHVSLYVEQERDLSDNSYINYEYDEVGNITKITKKKGKFLNGNITYQYDLLGRLLNEDDKLTDQKITYTYDNNGNIRHKYYYENNSKDSKKLIRKRLYRYEHTMKDIITGVSDCEMDGEVELSRKNISYIYDSNMKGYPSHINEKALLWDGHLLVQYDNTEFKYNCSGIRTEKKNGNGDITTYFLDNSKVLGIRWKSGMTGENKSMRFNYDHQDMIVGLNYNEKEYFYMRDILGIIHGIINEQGKRMVEYAYDAWGVPTKMSTCTGLTAEELTEAEAILALNPFIYKGYIYDKEMGLGNNISGFYYLNSRYYDPNTGRFISPDSLQYLQPNQVNGHNLYAYCVNNPVSYLDCNGNMPFFLLTGIIGAVVGAIAGGIIAACNGQNVWAGIGIGMVAGGLIGMGLGAVYAGAVAGSFTASVGAVKIGTTTTVSMFKAGGFTAGTYMIMDNLSNAIHPSTHVFWSGGYMQEDGTILDVAKINATEYANNNNGVTIGMTRLGQYLEKINASKELWNIASFNFASQVPYYGTAHAFLYYPGMDRTAVWITIELHELIRRFVEMTIGG